MELMDTLLGNLSLLPLEAKNWMFDIYFYDVFSLEFPVEWRTLSPPADLKGTIIVIPPRAANRERPIRHYPNPHAFMKREGKSIKAIAIAGVGSSVLGTAALARSIADYTGWDVAGIVTGCGWSDVAVEGLGGWSYYGEIDRLRYKLERALGRLLWPMGQARPSKATEALSDDQDKGIQDPSRRMGIAAPPSLFTGLGYPMGSLDVLGYSDVRTLHDILSEPHENLPALELLVGHSKGNLLISFVLNHINDALRDGEEPDSLFKYLTVVTLGAVVDIPTRELKLKKTHQFLGQLDPLGNLNSYRDPSFVGPITIEHTVIPGVGHHLNPFFGYNMSLSKVFKENTAIPVVVGAEKASEDGVGKIPTTWSPMDYPWNWPISPLSEVGSGHNY